MYKTDAEIESLLSHPNNGVRHHFIGQGNNPNSHGQAGGDHKKLSLEEKTDIGVLANVIGNKNTAELTGNEVTRVGQFKRGLNGNTPDSALRESMAAKIGSIQQKAVSKVDLLLDVISSDGMTPKDAAYTAEKMVSIYEKLAPKSPISAEKVEIHFYAPAMRKVEDYPIIDVEPVSK